MVVYLSSGLKLGCLKNVKYAETADVTNITVYRIPTNTAAWLQPCDVLLFGPAKQKVRHQHKYYIKHCNRTLLSMAALATCGATATINQKQA